MREFDYRKERLNNLFKTHSRNHIVLYGTGESVRMIIREFPNLNIIGLMDASKEGSYFCGRYVLSEREALLAGMDVLVIPARFDSALAVFERVFPFCHAHNVKVLDFFGNDMSVLNKYLVNHICSLPDKDSSDIEIEISNHNTIGFSVKNTLLCGPSAKPIARVPIINLLNEAAGAGKRIIIVNDIGFTNEECEVVLEQNGIAGEHTIICDNKNGLSLYDGAFQDYLNAAEGPMLHIGCDYVRDGYIPLAYGVDSFLIMTNVDLFRMVCPNVINELIIDDHVEELVCSIDPNRFMDPFGAFQKNCRILPKPCEGLRELILLDKQFVIESKSVGLSASIQKTILVTFLRVPHFDMYGGDRTVYCYLKLFVKMGLQVILLPSDFNGDDTYIEYMRDLGVDVLTGDYYRDNWLKWLMVYGDMIDYVFLQLPDQAEEYYEAMRCYCTKAKILYFEHDLGFLRKEREYSITGDESQRVDAELFKEREVRLMELADVSYLPGVIERDYMRGLLPNKPIKAIPVYVYDDTIAEIPRDFKKRKDIMIVAHVDFEQNLDGILWFRNTIFSRIVSVYPDLIWHIVGKVSDENRKMIERDGIVLHGYMTDDELLELYNSCRFEVVPLRFGSGVKGKIIEAAYHGLPVVTTPIGAEQIDINKGNIEVGDGKKELTDIIIDLYEDYEKLEHMSKMSFDFIMENYSSAVAERVLEEDIEV